MKQKKPTQSAYTSFNSTLQTKVSSHFSNGLAGFVALNYRKCKKVFLTFFQVVLYSLPHIVALTPSGLVSEAGQSASPSPNCCLRDC